MDNFIVSARKYRPATFKEVVGQDSITRTLKNAIRSGHLAQAFLFTGPRGVGKTTCARILAKTINCLNITEDTEPCNECETCTTFNTTSSFNIHELDAASNNSVDDIRSLVDQVRIPPQDGKYKVYIIDEVHMLSSAAFNAFLKTLEEPPAYAKFILATTEKHKIIPTILSRCQVYDFQRISVEDIRKHLAWVADTEHIEAEAEALHVIALKADGALRDALSIFDQINAFSGGSISYKATIENLNVLDHEYFFRCTDLILENDVPGILNLIEDVVARGFDGHHFLTGLGSHLRNLLMCRDPQTVALLEVSEGVRESYSKQAAKCTTPFLVEALKQQNQCDLDYKNSSNKRLLLELTLLRMLPAMSASSEAGSSEPALQGIKKKTNPIVTPAKAETIQKVEAKPGDKPVQSAPDPEPSSPSPSVKTNKTSTVAKTRSTPSIREALYSTSKKADKETIKDPDESGSDPVTNFNRDQFLEIWNEWIDEISAHLPSLANSLRKEEPVIGEDATITVKIENVVLEETLISVRADIQENLRKGLSNPDILVRTEIVENNGNEQKAFTSKEKFEAMIKINPGLKELRDEFDLDID